MPAGYTHYVFGEQVLDQLDENIKKRIMPYIDLYHIGIHGPDILFYYDVYKKNPEEWKNLTAKGMRKNYSWKASSRKYEKLYSDL